MHVARLPSISVRHRAGICAWTVAIVACSNAGESGDALSEYRPQELVTGRVIENNTACQVDAICSLELAFADTTVVAIYGTGLRQAPPCQSPAEVTNAAFASARGELVDVVIALCEGEPSIQRLSKVADSTATP
jgi:hypothetical protein